MSLFTIRHITTLMVWLGFLFSLALFQPACASPQLENTQPLTLIDRSVFEDNPVDLPSRDWQWMRNKRVLILGVAPPDLAPIEIISNNTYYEGFTADVVGLIGKLLHTEVRVIQFPDRSAALNALEQGTIDMVGSANNYELVNHRVQLTHTYIPDQPVLYVRKSEDRTIPAGLNGMRVALADDYLPMRQLVEFYPNAVFTPYKSREMALAALAFGNADVYLGDTVSSNYLVNLNYFNYVRMHASLDIPTGGAAFAIRSGNNQLEGVLNAALKVMREHYLADMLKRWSGGGSSVMTQELSLTPAEQRWIARNPVVRFVVSNDTAPMSYFDATGHFSGISADVLKAISLRTGLTFKTVRSDDAWDHVPLIVDGDADLTVSMPTLQREEFYLFTRPVVLTPFAIITRNESGQPKSLNELRGKRIALPLYHPLREILQPISEFRYVDANTLLDALDLVANGQADATATFLPVAQYYTMALHDGNLKISNIIPDSRASLAFAMRKSDTELASILNKALLQIPPDEIDVYQNRWRPKADVSEISWLDYRGLIYKVGGAAFIFLMLSLAWNLYIRSQYKRRQQAERALGEQLDFMRSLIDETPHPIYVLDRQGRMLTCNSSFLEVFKSTEKEVVGRTALDVGKFDRQEALQFHHDYMRVMDTGEPLVIDRVLRLPDRELSIFQWVNPYYDSQGNVKGVICGWIDISERRQLMEELRSALNEADQSSKAKTTFLATMSHEIRTPMSAVIGMLELAMKHADQGRFDRPAIEVAYDSARGLLELIGDILDVVRIESGHVSLSPKRANLRELVESVARVFDGLARQKALTLSLSIDSNVNRDVLVDPMRFKQVLSNLVGNAIKFTDTGEVKVTINGSLMEDGDDRLQVQLLVEDTGIGISAEELAKLFQPFAQANHGRTSRGGTGLGLAICKSLCELMGGKLSVRSSAGRGTCVSLNVPFNVLPEVPRVVHIQGDEGDKEHPKLNVLVVDDQQANRVLLAQQLAFFGQAVTSAENGEEGLRCWKEGSVDVVFTDCNMPVMNGYEMTRRIREMEQRDNRQRCIIIGFTANAQPEEKTKCVQAGMDDCLFKPVSLTALSSVLMSLSGSSQIADVEQERGGGRSIEAILHGLTGGDKAMMQALISEAHSSYTRDLAEVKGQLEHMVPDALSNLAHRIKGAARILQAQQVIDACDQIEQLCGEVPMDRDAVLDHVRVIEQELEGLIAQVCSISLTEETNQS